VRGRRGVFLLSLLLLSAATKVAPAADPDLSTRLSCEPIPAPGRVRCALQLAVPSDLRLSWVDALVVAAPAFARPLRSRVAQRKLTGQEGKAEVHLALLASSTGRGTLTVRGRAVVCPRTGPGACRPVSSAASVELLVGR
jgi:hypothetical protein